MSKCYQNSVESHRPSLCVCMCDQHIQIKTQTAKSKSISCSSGAMNGLTTGFCSIDDFEFAVFESCMLTKALSRWCDRKAFSCTDDHHKYKSTRNLFGFPKGCLSNVFLNYFHMDWKPFNSVKDTLLHYKVDFKSPPRAAQPGFWDATMTVLFY